MTSNRWSPGSAREAVKLGLLRDGKREETGLTTVPLGAKRNSAIPS